MKSGEWIPLKVGRWHHPLLLPSAQQCVCTCEGQRLPIKKKQKKTNSQMHAALPKGTRSQTLPAFILAEQSMRVSSPGFGLLQHCGTQRGVTPATAMNQKHCLIWITLAWSLPTVEWRLPGCSTARIEWETERPFVHSVTESWLMQRDGTSKWLMQRIMFDVALLRTQRDSTEVKPRFVCLRMMLCLTGSQQKKKVKDRKLNFYQTGCVDWLSCGPSGVFGGSQQTCRSEGSWWFFMVYIAGNCLVLEVLSDVISVIGAI